MGKLSDLFGRKKNASRGLVPESRRLEYEQQSRDRKMKRSKGHGEMQGEVAVQRISGQSSGISNRVESEAKANDDKEVYQFDMPMAELGFGDLLKEHQPGERMPGVAVSKKSTQPREAVMRELEQFQPDIERRQIKLPKKFVLPLIQQEERVGLSQIFTKLNPKYPYILIKKIKFVLTPLSSFFDNFTNVNAMILDTRMLNRPKRQTAKLNSNVDYRGSLSLDYCFPATSMDRMFLYIHLEVMLMEVGEEWGTMLIQIEAEELDFPIMEDFQPVSIVAQLPPSGLARYKYDPTHMDLTIRDVHRKKLLEMYENGELADSTKPILHKTGRVKYSATTVQEVRGPVVGMDGAVDWSNMRGQRMQEVDEQSYEPEVESEVGDTSQFKEMREQALLAVRKKEERREANPVQPDGDDGESVTSAELEALVNSRANKSLVQEPKVEPDALQKSSDNAVVKPRVNFNVEDVRE